MEKIKKVKNVSNESVELKLTSGIVYKIAPGDELKNLELTEDSARDQRLQVTRDLGEIIR